MTDAVYAELRREIRELAWTIVRFDQWEQEARAGSRWQRVADCQAQRELARQRRSALLYELWLARKDTN